METGRAISRLVRIRIVYGPHSPWRGDVQVTIEALWLKGLPYAPADDMDGIFIEEATADEDKLLAEMGFELERIH